MAVQKVPIKPKNFKLQLPLTAMLYPPPSVFSEQHRSVTNCNHLCETEPYSVWSGVRRGALERARASESGALCLCVSAKLAPVRLSVLICGSRIVVLPLQGC